MTMQSDQLEQLIDAHLAGLPVAVPASLQAEFQQAIEAHAALRGLLDETASHDANASLRPAPSVPDQYVIERELGRGGMGVVYLARQRSLNRRVALKVLRPGERAFGALVKRFLDEAQHLARLRHPNIVAIYDVGDAAGEPYFTMDFIEGESLAALIARGPLPPTQALEILKQVAAAIQHAHRHGIIHRDLKPANVLIDRAGQVFVTDFGLARDVSQESSLTQSGELLGTPQYMAPEQARGRTSLVGEATDIHALGLLLFEMLAGRAAFRAASPADVLVKLLNEEPPALRSLDRRIPKDLETICQKALQKSPTARYANVSALLEDVRRFEAGEPLLARRTGVVTRTARWAARRWKTAAVAAVTAVLALALMLALAPRLFDKSVEELIAWGGEELKAGHAEVAAQIFQRAWLRSEPAQRPDIEQQFAEAIREIENPQKAVDLALTLVESSPDVSFGEHDFLVAQAVAAAARADTPHGFFEPVHGEAPKSSLAKRELAARRLALFLDGPHGTPEQRAEAERTLQAIDRSLRGLRPAARWSGDDLVRLPEGELDELTRRAAEKALSPWERGKASLVLGRRHEAAGEHAQAVAAYRTALEQLQRVFPFVSGVSSETQLQATGDNNAAADSPECRLMRELLDSLARLDPQAAELARGGLRLRLDPAQLFQGVSVTVRLTLCDPAIRDPHQGLSRNLSMSVPIGPDGVAEVRVLPGKYRLAFSGTSTKWDVSAAGNIHLLDISADPWPKTLEIGDEMFDLPPVTVRKLKEIRLLQPTDLARLDLTSDSLAWEPAPDAAWYEVTLASFTDLPAPTSTWFLTARTEKPSLKPADLARQDRAALRRHWVAGRTVGFRVQAFNVAGQRIATSLEDRRFLIASPLRPE